MGQYDQLMPSLANESRASSRVGNVSCLALIGLLTHPERVDARRACTSASSKGFVRKCLTPKL